jgi:hypothetical protein
VDPTVRVGGAATMHRNRPSDREDETRPERLELCGRLVGHPVLVRRHLSDERRTPAHASVRAKA